MESPITQITQHVSEAEWNSDTLELTDEDLEQVTGAYWGSYGGFRHHYGFHRYPFRNDFDGGFSNTAIAINNVAIAG